MIFTAPAKINVSLRITGIDDKGYHLLEMVNLPIDLKDAVEIEKIEGSDCYVTCDDLVLSSIKENLCSKACSVLKETYHLEDNFMISVHKVIPFNAGLGGGSSNAATVLKAINFLSKLKKSDEELEELGLKLGADVPFFIESKPAVVTGIGEHISPFVIKKPIHVLLIKPEQGLSTKDIYKICDKTPRLNINTEKVVEGLKNHDFKLIQENSGNDLLAASMELCPDISKILNQCKELGFECYGMTGSGSCCYVLSDNVFALSRAFRKFKKKGFIVKLAKTLA